MRLMMGVLVLVAGFAQAAAAADVGQIKTAKGGVFVVRNGQEMAASPGTPLQQADRVVTKADGSAGITFRDDSLLSLGPDSMLDISHFSFQVKDQADGLEAFLHRGTLSAVSGRCRSIGMPSPVLPPIRFRARRRPAVPMPRWPWASLARAMSIPQFNLASPTIMLSSLN